jgi:hypothetical protein
MGRLGSTTTERAGEMRGVLGRWERSGLTLREFAQQRGIPLSTLTWWRRVFRGASEEGGKGVAAEKAAVFTEVLQPAKVARIPAVVEIVLSSGHVVRVPAGADTATLQRVLQALARTTC